jgi:hypothetical protein
MATPQLMLQPSLLMRSGLQIRQQNHVLLFKLTDELHARLEELLEKSKGQLITPSEVTELAGIQELERIFTLINSKLAALNQWSQSELETLSDNELRTDVNTATHLNL